MKRNMATIKQKKAAENLVGNGGNVTQAMIDAGYSSNTANTPQKLTESKAWEELKEKFIPDKDLAKVHKEGLKASRKTLMGEEPDYTVRHKYLETGYKIKGKMKDGIGDEPKPEIHIHNTKINIIITEAREKIKEQLGEDE